MSTEETNPQVSEENRESQATSAPKDDVGKKSNVPPKNNVSVATKPLDSAKTRFVIIGNGQGGTSIAQTLASVLPNNPFLISINSSDQDLAQVNLPDNQKFKIGPENQSGSGKNRNRAKAYFKNFSSTNIYNTDEKLDALSTFIGYYEEVLFHPTDQTVIFVCFSSDGGTGSGLGPMITASLSNYVNTVKEFRIGGKTYEIDDVTGSVPRPVVVGLTPKCAVNAGATNLQNTIECFVDIQKSIDASLGNFFIADNNLPPDVKYKDTDEMYRIINARICSPFVKFFGIEMNSSIKCMDLQDKINSLRIPGCSSFTTITKNNQFGYVVPRSQSVTRAVMMLNHDVEDLGAEEKSAKNLLNSVDVTSVDTTQVFFEVGQSGITADKVTKDLVEASMIGFFGFKSLNAIVEDLRDNLHRTQVANDKKASVVQEHSTGFSSVANDAAELNDRFGTKSMDQSSLMGLF